MRSMTGFGRADFRDQRAEISIEIRTVNHRYKDFFIKMPRMLNAIEDRVRDCIGKTLGRGRIEVFIKYHHLGESNIELVYNRELAKAYIDVLSEIMESDSRIQPHFNVELVARYPDIVSTREEPADLESIWQILEPTLIQCVAEVDKSRGSEGEKLKKSMLNHCDSIEDMTHRIAERAPEMVEAYGKELREKISELTETNTFDEHRIMMEVAIMADRLGIDEELTRLQVHLTRFREIIKNQEGPVGRQLDFLVQEMNREINTIGSKSNCIHISEHVVNIKSEIEKIREQVQNIE